MLLIELSPFILERPIGRGGMGEVWGAVHPQQRVPVAVKVLSGEIARRRGFVEAFNREARAVARLTHRGVVQVYDYGAITEAAAGASGGRLEPGSPYLVMELVEGGTLRERCGRVGWAEARRILLELLGALAHAHARGVIHRDIKPGNVLVGGDGGLRLADFGLAAGLTGADGRAMATGGTPAFMAPEQIEGRWREFGPWTDLYALGCLACALLSGCSPFAREGVVATRRAHLGPRPLPLAARCATPEGLDAWLARMLARDPGERYQCAAEAALGLSALGEAGDRSAQHAAMEPPAAEASAADTGGADESWAPFWTERGTFELGTASGGLPAVERGDRAEEGVGAPAISPASILSPEAPEDWRVAEQASLRSPLEGAGLGLFGLRRPPLVGREREQSALWAALRAVVGDGMPRAVVLRGQAGVGKSRLVRWLGERARELGIAHLLRASHGWPPSAADGLVPMLTRDLRCEELERLEIARRVAGVLPEATPRQVGALTELMRPLERGEVTRGVTPVTIERDDERWAALDDFLRLRGRRRPLVVWLDDVQWGRLSTAWCRRALGCGAPVLFVITVRDEALEQRPRAAAELAALEACDQTLTLHLTPLTPRAQEALVTHLLGLGAEVAASVVERTGGNPLFAVQLVGDWVERGLLIPALGGFVTAPGADLRVPDAIHELWVERLEHLLGARGEDERRALELAALLGTRVAASEWAAACERAGLGVPRALAEALQRQGLARESDGGWSFAHGMLAESLIRLCDEAGRITAARGAAGGALSALGLSLINRRRQEAERLLRRASGLLDLPEHRGEWARVHGAWGYTQFSLGRVQRGREALSSALEGARREGTLEVELGLVQYLATIKGETGEAREVCALVTPALSRARAAGARLSEAYLLSALGSAACDLGSFAEGAAHKREALAIFEALGEREAAGIEMSALALTLARMGEQRQALGFHQRSLAIAEEAGSLFHQGVAHLNLGFLLSDIGEPEQALDHYQQALALHRQLGTRSSEARALSNMGSLLRQFGRLEEARERYEEALRIQRELGNPRSQGIILSNLGNLLSQRGDMEAAEVCYEQALQLHRASGEPYFIACTLYNLAHKRCRQGRLAQARRDYSEVLSLFKEVGARHQEGVVYASLGEVLALGGELEEGADYLLRSIARMREVEDPVYEENALYLLALVRLALGENEAALTLLGEALERARSNRQPRREGLVLGALAEALERCGEPAAGLAALEQAVALCEAAREPFAGVLLGRLGRRRALRGEHAEARRLLEEGFRRLQGTGYRPELGALLVQQAAIERLCGDLPAARAALEHVTQMYRQLGVSDRSWPGRALREERDALLRAGDPVRRPADLEVQEVRPAVLVRGPAQV